MFSVGIFTTHLPYIAIVAFYAYILIFGVEKAPDSDIRNESFLTIEIDTDNFDIEACYFVNNYISKTKDIDANIAIESYVFKRKMKHPGFIYSHKRQEYFCSTSISRPPPSL